MGERGVVLVKLPGISPLPVSGGQAGGSGLVEGPALRLTRTEESEGRIK